MKHSLRCRKCKKFIGQYPNYAITTALCNKCPYDGQLFAHKENSLFFMGFYLIQIDKSCTETDIISVTLTSRGSL